MRFAVILQVIGRSFSCYPHKKSVPKHSERRACRPIDSIAAPGNPLYRSGWLLLVSPENGPAAAFSCFLLPPCASLVVIRSGRSSWRNLSWRGSGRIGGRVWLSSSSLYGLGNGMVIRSRLLIIWSLIGWLLIHRLRISGALVRRPLIGGLRIDRLLIGRGCYRPGEWPVVHRLAGRRILRSLVDRTACGLGERPVSCPSWGLRRLLSAGLDHRLASGLPVDGLLTNRLPIDGPLIYRLLITRLLIRRLLINGPLINRLLVDWLLVRRLRIARLRYRPVEWPAVYRLAVQGLAGRMRLRSLIDRTACGLAGRRPGRGIVIPTVVIADIISPVVVIAVAAIIPIPAVDGSVDGTGIVEGLYPGRGNTGSSSAISPVALWGAIDPWTVNSQGIIVELLTGRIALPDSDRSYRSAGISSHFLRIRTTPVIDIPVPAIALIVRSISVIDDRDIVDDRSFVDDRHIPGRIHIIIAHLGAADILMRHKRPILGRGIVAASKRDVHADIRSQGRPSIILIAASPAYPGGSPFRSGHPHPSIAVLKEPAAIVEGSPAPGIIGSPGPAIFRIDPTAIGSIRLKIRTGIR